MTFILESAFIGGKPNGDIDRDCKQYDCPNWDEVTSSNTEGGLLTALVSMMNSEEIDDVNLWYRVTDTKKRKVITGEDYGKETN